MCVLKAKKNIDVRKFAYEIAVSRNLVFPASWKKTKCAGPDWLRSFCFVTHSSLISLHRKRIERNHNWTLIVDTAVEVFREILSLIFVRHVAW